MAISEKLEGGGRRGRGWGGAEGEQTGNNRKTNWKQWKQRKRRNGSNKKKRRRRRRLQRRRRRRRRRKGGGEEAE